jgi:ACR3 family arsenite transporter
MVLIWNELAAGDAELCAVMVAFNSVLQIVLYAPLSLLYLHVRIHPTSTYLLLGGWV